MGVQKQEDNRLPWWMVVWFYVTALVCTYDASFVVFRPYTLPGGQLWGFFRLYKYYIYTDQRYRDVNDSYSYTQSLMNYAEVIINIVTLVYHYKNRAETKALAFTVCVMTFWKTVLYIAMFYELAGGQNFREGNTLLQEIFLVLIPNGVWIVLPLICMKNLWSTLIDTTRVKVY